MLEVRQLRFNRGVLPVMRFANEEDVLAELQKLREANVVTCQFLQTLRDC